MDPAAAAASPPLLRWRTRIWPPPPPLPLSVGGARGSGRLHAQEEEVVVEQAPTEEEWLDGELSRLAQVDERAVLKHFDWPEGKTYALREAAFGYRDLKKIESEAAAFGDDPLKQPKVSVKGKNSHHTVRSPKVDNPCHVHVHVMVDPDAPSPSKPEYREYLHWIGMQPSQK